MIWILTSTRLPGTGIARNSASENEAKTKRSGSHDHRVDVDAREQQGRQAHADTAMAFAFVRAVYEWASRHDGVGRRMVIPRSGEVDADELKKVIVASSSTRESKEKERT